MDGCHVTSMKDLYYKPVPEEYSEVVSSEIISKEQEKNMEDKFAFIFAPRFWAIVLNSVSITLIDPNFPTQPWYVTLGKFFALLAS